MLWKDISCCSVVMDATFLQQLNHCWLLKRLEPVLWIGIPSFYANPDLDPDPDPTFHFDAYTDTDTEPDSTQDLDILENPIFLTLIHSSARLHCFIFLVSIKSVIIFNILDSTVY